MSHFLPGASLRRKPVLTIFIWFLYAASAYHFVRYYVISATFYLRMQDYLSGHERLPFQERILPALLIKGILGLPSINSLFLHRQGVFSTPDRGAFFLLSFFAFIVASIFCVKLYNVVSTRHTLGFLVYPLFLYTTMWSYSIHLEQNYSYPYDLLSLAFFTAGLYFIFTRRFWLLAAVVFLGTFNRETTLFLIGLYIIDAVSIDSADHLTSIRQRFNLTCIPWLRVVLLVLIWGAIKSGLHHLYAHNDTSEDYLRIRENVKVFLPKNWPGVFNICGYLLPLVVIFRHRIQPTRFANYLYICVPWVLVMSCAGLLIETRIYGELSSFVAIAVVLQLENYMANEGTLSQKPNVEGSNVAFR